jgi:osmotically-inducible protein OsmY
VCVGEQTILAGSTILGFIGGSLQSDCTRRPAQEQESLHYQGHPMKNVKFATTLIAALMLTTVVGCASTASDKHETAGQYIDDAAVTTSVKAAIVKEPSLKVAEINVETYKGVVQLSGFVSSAENIATATTVARSVNGVKSVKNDLRLK